MCITVLFAGAAAGLIKICRVAVGRCAVESDKPGIAVQTNEYSLCFRS